MTKNRKLWLLIGLVVAVAAIVAVVAGPRIYASMQPEAKAPLSVSTPTATSPTFLATTGQRPDGADDGTWTVASGSQAGYRIDEVLNGADVTVVGRTEKVTGTATVADGVLTAASVVVDVASITTDNGNRDSYFRSTALRTSQFPTATFALGTPVTLPEIGANPVEVPVSGTLELAGQTRDVTATLSVVRDGESVSASGAIPVTVSDYGIQAPDLGFVKVEPAGQVEFLVHLQQQ
ncbi:YceI family protein [Sinomonas mesophila]|uniref:YceI family protein n=1 Tax=Sinomonas mesophila TaxID=1531955 RepID=UPI001115A8AE|nr:YceI family protein [Sinomonas mesophila]